VLSETLNFYLRIKQSRMVTDCLLQSDCL